MDFENEIESYSRAMENHVRSRQEERRSKVEVERTRKALQIARDALRSKEIDILDDFDIHHLTVTKSKPVSCKICNDTGEIHTDGQDKDGNIETGVNTQACPCCRKLERSRVH